MLKVSLREREREWVRWTKGELESQKIGEEREEANLKNGFYFYNIWPLASTSKSLKYEMPKFFSIWET